MNSHVLLDLCAVEDERSLSWILFLFYTHSLRKLIQLIQYFTTHAGLQANGSQCSIFSVDNVFVLQFHAFSCLLAMPTWMSTRCFNTHPNKTPLTSFSLSVPASTLLPCVVQAKNVEDILTFPYFPPTPDI